MVKFIEVKDRKQMTERKAIINFTKPEKIRGCLINKDTVSPQMFNSWMSKNSGVQITIMNYLKSKISSYCQVMYCKFLREDDQGNGFKPARFLAHGGNVLISSKGGHRHYYHLEKFSPNDLKNSHFLTI